MIPIKFTLLGTGGPRPDPNRQGAAIAVQIGNEIALFDAGRGVSAQLVRAGIQPQQINSIFITHHHFDHIGNLGDLILTAWNNGRSDPLSIIGPRGTKAIVDALLNTVYRADIEFRLAEAALSDAKLVDVRQMVQVRDVEAGMVFDNGRYRVHADYVMHGHGLGMTQETWPCFGYRIEAAGKIVTISGDTVDCPGIDRLAQDADLLALCCYLAQAEIVDADTELVARHILASSGQVGKIAARANVKTLVLTHFREKSAEMMNSIVADVRQDYSGTLFLGEDLMEIKVNAAAV